ncbi:hypothetical protein T4B_4801 [Trichinella pseudospiralis]|uniref:Uncharacterized protein n=1 Tax=Trichinella pseudospiralis TaxID=6337 RepID=A0A0V1JRD3_TRIPS|nr:hypothetical protein T4B_4801 [Trichinella pseudospiralis]KRZ37539.1 hypothetical protein T4C_10877 [Trichinella pseudospiralis]
MLSLKAVYSKSYRPVGQSKKVQIVKKIFRRFSQNKQVKQAQEILKFSRKTSKIRNFRETLFSSKVDKMERFTKYNEPIMAAQRCVFLGII